MSNLITGTQLQRDDLTGENTIEELVRLGRWACIVGYRSLTDEVEKCEHEDRERMLKPVFRELGYQIELYKYQILRMASRGYVDPGAPAHLIPIRIEKAPGAVYDTTTNQVKLDVGQRVYFEDPIIVESGMDFLLVVAR
ncbi:hypothetical protein IFR05_014258 [Cadophora sp. M221]|nr:hypothetical protein IFR05_014258 [Cadophora sp. M221]